LPADEELNMPRAFRFLAERNKRIGTVKLPILAVQFCVDTTARIQVLEGSVVATSHLSLSGMVAGVA